MTIVVVIGLLMVLMGIAESLKHRACTLAVEAHVADYGNWGGGDDNEYRPLVEYAQNGKTVRSSIEADSTVVRKWVLEEVKNAYPIGKTVTVYINPDKPGYCFLDPQRGKNDGFLMAGLGIALIILILS